MRHNSLEYKVSAATLRLLSTAPNGELTIRQIIGQLPVALSLPAEALQASETRQGELLFEQIVRNIVCHKENEGNFIFEGLIEHARRGVLKITTAGLSTLRSAA